MVRDIMDSGLIASRETEEQIKALQELETMAHVWI